MKHGGKRKESGPKALVGLLTMQGIKARHIKHGRKCKCGQYVLVNTVKGWPDVEVFLKCGRLVFIEWKGAASSGERTAEGALNADQKIRIEELRELGYPVLVTGDYDAALTWVREQQRMWERNR